MITLDEFITKYNGQYIGDHECGTLVRAYCIEVQGYTPPSHPSAKDYWTYGIPGYDKVGSPQVGDIAVYDGHGTYTDGHIAVYTGSSQVFEQNADPDGSPAHLFARANTYLLGYLRKQGETMSTWTNGDTYNLLYHAVSPSAAITAQKANYEGYFGAQDGQESNSAFNTIISSPQFDFMVADSKSSAGFTPYSGSQLYTKG